MQTLGALVIVALASNFVHSTEVVCYFTNWATYRSGIAQFHPSDIDPKLCTIINYAFVGVWGDTGRLRVLDDYSDNSLGNLQGVLDLKKDNPNLKVLISMGGWNEGSANYSRVAGNKTLRGNFVRSVISYIEEHDFDGFDLDWEYPVARNGSAEDKENFNALLHELQQYLHVRGLLLTVAVAGAGPQVNESYNVKELMRRVDYVNVMFYDLQTATSANDTAAHAPLYPSPRDSEEERQLSVQGGLNQWLELGADPAKLILGIPFYARTFNLTNPINHGLGAPSIGAGPAGPLTLSEGFLSYQEICNYYQNFTFVRDEEQQAPYAYSGSTWFSYDDVESVRAKTEFALSQKLAGVMIYSLDYDDFSNTCGDGRYPLLNTVVETIRGNSK